MKFKIALLLSIIIVGCIIIKHEQSQVKYVDIECPVCGSAEVLDFGIDTNTGCQKAHCADCSSEFYINM